MGRDRDDTLLGVIFHKGDIDIINIHYSEGHSSVNTLTGLPQTLQMGDLISQ